MRAGLPVIVPDNPSVCGAIKHLQNGIVYPEGNNIIASECIKRLLDDESLRTKIGIGAKATAKEYSLEKTHLALVKAFEDIINRKMHTK